MAAVPPRQVARGRDQDRLVVHLQLAGKAVLSSGDVVQAASRAARAFFATPGTITSALRSAAEAINDHLHERNRQSPGQGMYAVGYLALASIRESEMTILLSGPMQAFVLRTDGVRHIADSLSGRGLGLGTATAHYFAKLALEPDVKVLLCGALPAGWDAALQNLSPTDLEATRRRLMNSATQDVNAVLMQAGEGEGALHLVRPAVAPNKGAATEDAPPQVDLPSLEPEAAPSAYAIPPARPTEVPPPDDQPAPDAPQLMISAAVEPGSAAPRSLTLVPMERQKQVARWAVKALRGVRAVADRSGKLLGGFLPSLLPTQQPNPWSLGSPAMMFIAVLVPLVVVTIASAVYFRYGRSVQYEQYLVLARDARAQASTLADAVAQREAWQRELFYLDRADDYNETGETRQLREEAQQKLDEVLGIRRLQFQPALSRSVDAQIGRVAAGENDVYLLDAQRGSVLHMALTNTGFELDSTFDCGPGTYGPYTVGPLVDILALPTLNSLNARMLGVDAGGTLLYCTPGQVAQAIPLAAPDTNWRRIRSITIDSGNLYVLDAEARAVWVYLGDDGAFVDRPYFFFGGEIPALEDAIDLAVNADDLYVLHSDGRISTCSYSRIESVPTRCVDPALLANPLPAYRDQDLFSQAHFTQMMFSPPPDSTLLLLDAENQGVYRFNGRSLELQAHMRPLAGRANGMPAGQVTAMGIGPNHVLYFALRDRLYFAADAP
jgi:hypothetical protein